VLSAIVGVAIRQGISDAACGGQCQWFAAALSVAAAIFIMMATKSLHPPGGATALIAVTGDASIRNLGFLYVLVPAGVGAVALLLVALVVNNLATHRAYPVYWW